jgi:hypothetical protein
MALRDCCHSVALLSDQHGVDLWKDGAARGVIILLLLSRCERVLCDSIFHHIHLYRDG